MTHDTLNISQALAVFLILSLSAIAQAQGPPTPVSGATQMNQRISLDLKGVDILDVLKLLSQKSGLNFVAGRNVSGRVTIFVNNVDVWEAFELIATANELAYERRGDIVTVMMARDYELLYGERFKDRKESRVIPLRYAKVAQVATVLNQIKSAIGRVVADEATNTLIVNDVPVRITEMQALLKELDRPTQSRLFSLNYSEAEKLKEKIQEHLSPLGTFTFDARTNKVMVSDLPEVVRKVEQLIRAFDTPEGEVLIEAKIVKVDLTDEMDLGIDWQRMFSGIIDTTVRNNFDVISGDVAAGTATGAALKLVGSSRSGTQVIIEALKKITKTETLSNPRIMVSNNQEAKILVGTKEAIVTVTTTVPATGSTVSAPEIQYVDVGTKLFVTPNIKGDGRIQMKVRPEVSSAKVETFQTNRIPIVTATEAETNVLVDSGVTLIIGGLIETKDEQTRSQVPFLGDLPVIGAAFRGTTNIRRKTELVLFLTPQIVLPDGSAAAALPLAPEPTGASSVPEITLEDPVPVAYRFAVRRRLQEHLAAQFRRSSLLTGSVVVSFILSHDGRLMGTPNITSPQGEPFIAAAQQAFAEADPFPAFPEGSRASEVRFRMAVEYAP